MKKNLWIFLLLSPMFFWTSVAWAYPDTLSNESLLIKIDQLIERKGDIQHQRSLRADSLNAIIRASSGDERLLALKSLYSLYESFQTDSTMSVLDRIEQTPEYETDSMLQAYCFLARARVYGVMGLYANAYENIEQVRREELNDTLRLQYFNVCHALFGWIADFCHRSQPKMASYFRNRAYAYHDSIIALEPDADNRIIVQTNKLYDENKYQACIDTLLLHVDKWTPGQKVYAYSRLAQAYEKLGKNAYAVYYLALTAIGDLEQGNTEYMALPILAEYLYETGDNERAYNYLLCSLEDATLCHAGLRTIESSAIFPIIDRARHASEVQQKRIGNWLIGILVVWGLVLTFGIWGLARQRRRLRHAQKALAEANGHLKQGNQRLQIANQQLHETDKMKEDYLMQYLSRSRRYLGAMESFQRQMYRLLQAHQIEELSKQLKSTQLIADEQAHFYADFDEAFLKLYPNFINDFNALLLPEARITPKRGELLTTELRIFALIRLGETDSNQIAKFLGYSLTTIYNYRSRVRNNALGDKEQFEELVMKL